MEDLLRAGFKSNLPEPGNEAWIHAMVKHLTPIFLFSPLFYRTHISSFITALIVPTVSIPSIDIFWSFIDACTDLRIIRVLSIKFNAAFHFSYSVNVII